MNAYSLSRLFIAAHLPRDTVIRSSAAGSRGGKAPPAAAEDNTLSIHIDDMLRPWRGDLPWHDRPSYHSGINHLQQDLLFY